MKTASWIVLAVLGGAILVLSLVSLRVAYVTGQERIGGRTLDELAAGRSEVVTALRARRGTAAAYATGFATFFLAIVLGPYRRGDRWSWWALLAGTLVLAVCAVLRVPLLGTDAGFQAPSIIFGVTLLGLLLDVGRLKSSATP